MSKLTHDDVQSYLDHRGIADSSKRVYKPILDRFIDEIRPGTDKWEIRAVSWIKGKKLLPKTQSLHVSTVRTFLNWCVRKGLADDNPMLDVSIRLPAAKAKKTFSDEDVQKIFAAIQSNGSASSIERAARDRAAITLMLYTAMRVGGAASIEIEDFSQAGDRTIVRYQNKGGAGKDSTSVLTPPVLKVIGEYLDATGRTMKSTGALFRGPHGRLTTAGLAYSIEQRFAAAGFPDASPHILRHTAATRAYMRGSDLRSIRDMLGHGSVSTTEGYLRSLDRTIRPAEDMIDYGEGEE